MSGTALAVALGFMSLAAAGPFQRRTEIVETVQKAGPAVVNISAEQRVANPFYNDPFGDFFRNFFEGRGGEETIQNSLGSGVLIDADGYVLTNDHVIASASRIKVTLSDKREFWAEIVGVAEESDLAVLKIKSKTPLPAVALGSSDDLMIGETVIAIGNPFGLSNTVTTGVLSAVHRSGRSGDRVYTDFLQTDAAINPGNSGGALLNINGELVGINAAIISPAQGIGFAIPIDRARKIYRELVQYGEVRPVYLGIDARQLDPRTAREMGLNAAKGLLVTKTRGPGIKAGVKLGDVIIEADGSPIESPEDLATALGRKNVGESMKLVVDRDGQRTPLQLQTVEFPFGEFAYEAIGIRVSEIPKADKRRRGVPEEGIVIAGIRPGGPAARKGLREGDYIVQVLDAAIANVSDFNRVLPRVASMQKGSIFLRVVRGGYLIPLSLGLD